MSDKVGLYVRPESSPLVMVVANGVKALGLHPLFRNPNPFTPEQVEDFSWIIIFGTTGKQEMIAREYLAKNVPVILVVFSVDKKMTVMSLSKKDANRPALEWATTDMIVGKPFQQCSNYPLPGLAPWTQELTALESDEPKTETERTDSNPDPKSDEPDQKPSLPAPLPEKKKPGRPPKQPEAPVEKKKPGRPSKVK